MIDSGYFEMNSQNSMTGLYSAKKSNNGQWGALIKESGKLSKDGDSQRFVCVTDGDHGNATEAANAVAPLLAQAPGAGGVFFNNFDFHYTKALGKIGGLRNYKLAASPKNDSSIYGSAQMLANTMHKAKNIQGITWVSTLGGSAVLTQAMNMLVDMNVKLNNHSAFLYRPRTNTTRAVEFAHKLDMKLDRNFSKTDAFDYMGNRNQISTIYRRFRREKDYHFGNAFFDLACQGGKVQGIAGMAIGAATLAGAPMAVPTIPIFASIAAAIGTTAGALKIGDSLAESVAPYWYNKHIGKIK